VPDEHERLGPFLGVSCLAWRLINRIERHDTSLILKAVGCAGGLELAFGRGHAVLLALVDSDRLA
jgi:hypothetical protein